VLRSPAPERSSGLYLEFLDHGLCQHPVVVGVVVGDFPHNHSWRWALIQP